MATFKPTFHFIYFKELNIFTNDIGQIHATIENPIISPKYSDKVMGFFILNLFL